MQRILVLAVVQVIWLFITAALLLVCWNNIGAHEVFHMARATYQQAVLVCVLVDIAAYWRASRASVID